MQLKNDGHVWTTNCHQSLSKEKTNKLEIWCCSHNLSHYTNYFYMQLGVKITNFATCLPPYFFPLKKKHRMQTSVGFSGVRYIFPSCFFIILLHRFIHYSQVLTPLPRNIFRDA